MCRSCEHRARALPGSPDSRRLGRECSAQPQDTLALPRRVGPRRGVMSRLFTAAQVSSPGRRGRGARKGPGPQDQVWKRRGPAPGCLSSEAGGFRDHELWSECPLRITTRTHS